MAFGPEAESSSNDEGLAELARRIQTGDRAAIQEFHSLFSAGIEFLLRRRLQQPTVSAQAASVLKAVVQQIQGSSPAQSVNLHRLVAQTIRLQFPSAGHGLESGTSDASGDRLAKSLMRERTPLEQEILRLYYVLGESPDTIQTRLRVSSETIEQTIASARADFQRRMRRSEPA